MTNEELISKVITGLVEQGGPGCDHEYRCLYRGPHGRKCAAGLLILDKHYHRTLENQPVQREDVQQALIRSGVQPRQLGLVDTLQRVHDAATARVSLSQLGSWRRILIEECEERGLEVPR